MNFFIRMSTIYCQISIHVRWNKGGKLNKARSIEGSKRSQVELINWCSQVELIYRNDESKCKKARGWTITVWSIALFRIDSILFLRRKWLLLKHPSKYLYTFQSDSFLSTCVTHTHTCHYLAAAHMKHSTFEEDRYFLYTILRQWPFPKLCLTKREVSSLSRI